MEFIDLLQKVKKFFDRNGLIDIKYNIIGIHCIEIRAVEILTGEVIAIINYCDSNNNIEVSITGETYFTVTPEKLLERLFDFDEQYQKFLDNLTKLDNYERKEDEGTERFL